MPALAKRRGARSAFNYWPGFVDALSTLLLAIIFLISIFMLGQFFLAREISTQETALERLNRQISELTADGKTAVSASHMPSGLRPKRYSKSLMPQITCVRLSRVLASGMIR